MAEEIKVVAEEAIEKKPAKKAAAKPAAEKKTAAKKPASKKADGETAAKKPAKKAAASAAEKKAPAKKAAANGVTIKLVKSLIGRSVNQIATANSLGLKKLGDVTVQPDNTATNGKINRISHMVEVTKA